MTSHPGAQASPPSVLRTLPRLVLGLVMCGSSIAVMVQAGLGLGPWDVFHQGVSLRSGLSIGTVNILTGAAVLALWVPLKQRLGIGTVINVVVIGLALDATLLVLPAPESLLVRWVTFALAMPVFAAGVGLYLGAGLGPGPRDGVMTGLAERGIPVGLARAVVELTALVSGWFLGGTVGIGTVVYAAAIGPLIHVLLPRLRAPWFPPGTRPRTFGDRDRWVITG
jgi:uncharacterized membrane protein YczE